MAAPITSCPPPNTLEDFRLGRLDDEVADTIGEHLELCGECRRRMWSMLGDNLRRHETSPPPAGAPDTVSLAETGPSSASRDAAAALRSAPPELAQHPDYELLHELGRGGMGVVYLARNRLMDRLEVLKTVNKAVLERSQAVDRFQQEIRSAARLSHANIVAAYGVLRLGELLVLAMEYVDGKDLAHVVAQRGPLPVLNAAYYAHQAASGLQHAFERGMVHRDIKPSNLILAQQGRRHVVKILDFGLAKLTSENAADLALTASGQIFGTPHYMAPEQTRDARTVDIRADIYSLGCTLYYLLAGRAPFQADSLYELLRAHHEISAQPLDQLRADVPGELAAVVARMLAKQPCDRYQTPAEVEQALKPFYKGGSSGQAAAAGPPPASGLPSVPAPPKVPTRAPAPPARRSAAPRPVLAEVVRRNVPQRVAQAGLGLWSLILAMVGGAMVLGAVAGLAVAAAHAQGTAEASPLAVVLVCALLAGVGINVLGVLLGAAGLFQPREKSLAVLGTAFNGLVLLGIAAMIVLGALLG